MLQQGGFYPHLGVIVGVGFYGIAKLVSFCSVLLVFLAYPVGLYVWLGATCEDKRYAACTPPDRQKGCEIGCKCRFYRAIGVRDGYSALS